MSSPIRTLLGAPVLMAALACGGSHPSGLVPDPIPGPGDYRRTIVSDGFERVYEIHVPPAWQPGARLPLVLAFHGVASSPAGMRSVTRFDGLADQMGFVAVYPGARSGDWATGCIACVSGAALLRIDDVRFVRELLDRLEVDLGLDRGRVYAVGFSNGALFVHRLACDAPDAIAGFASVGATMIDPAFVPACDPGRSRPIVFVHGTEDPLFPPEGRTFGSGPDAARTLGIGETISIWRDLHGCPTSVTVTTLADLVDDGTIVRRHESSNCSGGSSVLYYEVVGGGHTWPGTGEGITSVGRVSNDIDASEVILELFL
jgi:polyhydroxybutyrate depolymerase